MKEATKLLYVEDDKVDQMAFERFVQMHEPSFDYIIAGSVTEAIDTVSSQQFDVILSDFQLGDGTLFDFLPHIKELPVVVVTGTGDEETAVEAMKRGVSDYLIKDPDGHYLKMVPSTIRNALSRKHAENELKRYQEHLEELVEERTAALEESEGRFRSLIKNAPIVVMHISPDYRILEFNTEAEKLFGKTREEVLGQDYIELFIPEHEREPVKKDIEKVLAGTPTKDFENEVIAHDDIKRLLSWNVDRILDSTGEPAGIITTGLDITEKKEAEIKLQAANQQLSASEQQLRAANQQLSASEAKLTATNQQLQSLFDGLSATGIGIDIVDKDYTIHFQNKVLEEGFGDLHGKVCHREYMGRNVPCDSCPLQKALKNNSVETLELEAPNGRNYKLFSAPFPSPDGTLDKAIEVVIDITEQKQAREELKKSEEWFRALIENSASVYSVVDTKGNALYQSPSLERVYGWTPEEVKGKPIFERIHPDDLGLVSQGFHEILQKPGNVKTMEVRYKHKNGTWRIIETTGANHLDNPAIGGIMITSHDITDRKGAEKKLLLSEEKFSKAFRSSPDYISITSLSDGTIVDINEGIEREFFFKREEILGKPITELNLYANPDDRQKFADILKREGRVREFETEFNTKTGNRITCLLNAEVIEISGEKYILTITRDITERKQATEALRKSEERFRSLFDSTNEGVALHEIIYDETDKPVDYRILDVNHAFETITGIKKEDAVGAIATELYKTNEAPFLDVYAKVAASGKPANFETTFEPISKSFKISVFSPTKGQFATLFDDITERKKAVEEMEKLATVVKHSSELVNLGTLEGNMIFLNEAGGRMLGIDPEEVEHTNIMEVIPEHLVELVEKELLPTLMSGEIWEGDLQYRNLKSGKLTDVHATTFTVKDPDTGKPQFLANVSLDITERKRAEKELQEREQTLRALINAPTETAILVDPKGKILAINEIGAQRLGKSVDACIGLGIFEYLPPDLAKSRKSHAYNVVRTGEPVRFEDSRASIYFDNNLYPVFNSEGKVTALAIYARDITEQKVAEDALQKEKDFSLNVIQSSPAFFVAIAPDGKITMVNNAMLTALGYTKEEVIGQDYLSTLVPEREHENLSENFSLLVKGENTLNENHILARDGQELLVEWHGTPVFNDSKEPEYFFGIGLDITERKKIESALKESDARFRQIAENIQETFFLIDKETRKILYVSPAIEKIVGTPLSAIQNKPLLLADLIHPDDKERVAFADEIKRYSQPLDEEFRIIRPDGEVRWLGLHSVLVYNNDGEVYRITGVVSDITDFKNAQEEARLRQLQLIQADKMASLGILVSGVAHEINNPNNFIMLNAKIFGKAWNDILPILRDYYSNTGDFLIADLPFSQAYDRIKNLIGGVIEGGDRIKNIVDNLKNFARQDTGALNQEIDVNRVIESSTVILNNLIKKSTGHFKVRLGKNLPVIAGNFQQIEQVIINLITNACQALPDNTRGISISTRFDKTRECVKISVKDEGKGISKENRDHVMDPFYTTKRDTGGTGLGLSISYNIIKNHNGSLDITSQGEKGTTVTITLPVQQISAS